MLNYSFWEGLDVHCKYILENWENRYKNQLKNYLAKFDDVNLFALCEMLKLLPNSEISSDAKKEYLKILLQSNRTQELELLRHFLAYKVDIIGDHYDRLVEAQIIIKPKRGNAFLKLVDIYLHESKELTNLLIYSKWVRNASFAEKFKPSIPLKINFVTEFESKLSSFTTKLRKGNYKNLSFKYFGKVAQTEKHIFDIDRQIGDKLIKNIDKNKRNKLASDLLLSFNLDRDLLEVRCKDPRIIKKSVSILEEIIRIRFIKYMPEATEVNNNKFTNYIEEKPENVNLKIVGISFRNSKLVGSVPLGIPPSYKVESVEESIADLKSRQIIDTEITNITSINVRHDDKIKDIELFNEGRYLYFGLRKGSRLNDSELNKLSEEFEKIFGLGLNEKFSINLKDSLEDDINHIINKKSVDCNNAVLLSALGVLENKKLVTKREKNVYQCHICRKTNSRGGNCSHCNSSETSILESGFLVEIPRDRIVSFLISLLEEGIKVESKDMVRTWSKPYYFLRLSWNQMPIYIFVSFASLSAKIISHFRRSGLPIIIVSVGSHQNKDVSELSNFVEFDLTKLILEQLSAQEFNRLLKENVNSSSATITLRAKESIKKLIEPRDYHHDSFEDDTINILQYLFKSVEKWGKEKRGREIPEGLVYLSFLTNTGVNSRTFTWDCKYTYNEKYELGIGEKRKAESYIRQLIKSKEIKQFSESLDAYLLVINKVDENQFRKLAEYVIPKIRSWKGNIVLLKLEELIMLHNLFDRYSANQQFNFNEFKAKFANLVLRKRKERIIILREEDIKTLFL